MLGLLDDMWMRYVTDIGMAGPDKGQGGKYLILPPGHDGPVPEGYFVSQSATHGVWMLLRAIDSEPADATARLKQLRINPLDMQNHPPAMRFVDGSGKQIDTIAPDDYRYFEQLGLVVQADSAGALTSLEHFYLAELGMGSGVIFAPDQKMAALLAEAAAIGQALVRMSSFASTDPAAAVYPDRHWRWAFLGGSHTFDAQGYANPDRRSAFAYAATGNTPAMTSQVVGAGCQYYLDALRRLWGLPGRWPTLQPPPAPDIPVKDFWSVTVYVAGSRSMLRNGTRFPSVSQYTDPHFNAGGSIDIHFGPDAPQGREQNWIRTVPGKGWFPILRFYGPLQPFFTKTWRPDDIQCTQ